MSKIGWVTPIVAGLTFGVCVFAYVRVLPFERTLMETARAASPIAEMKPLIDELSATTPQPTSARQRELVEQVARVFAERGLPVQPSVRVDSPGAAMTAYRQASAITAAELAQRLAGLADEYPREWEVRREASRLALTAAAVFQQFQFDEPVAKMTALAERLTPSARQDGAGNVELHPAGEWLWAATVYENLDRLENGATRPVSQDPKDGATRSPTPASQFWEAGVAALMKARELDPYSLPPVLKLFERAREQGDGEATKRWAGVMLELNAVKRLDREGSGLTSRERSEAESVLGKP